MAHLERRLCFRRIPLPCDRDGRCHGCSAAGARGPGPARSFADVRRRAPRYRRLPRGRRVRLRERRVLPGFLGLGQPGTARAHGACPRGGRVGRAGRPRRRLSRRFRRAGRLDRTLAVVDDGRARHRPRGRAGACVPRRRGRGRPVATATIGRVGRRRALGCAGGRRDVCPPDAPLPGPVRRVRPDLGLPPLRSARLLERARDPRRHGLAPRPRAGSAKRAARPLPVGGIDRDLRARALFHVQPGQLDRALRRARGRGRARQAPAPADHNGARARTLVDHRGRGRLDLSRADAPERRPQRRQPRRPRARRDRDRPGRRRLTDDPARRLAQRPPSRFRMACGGCTPAPCSSCSWRS